MFSSEQLRIIGDLIFIETFAVPFFHVGTDFLMHGETRKAITAYGIGVIPTLLGLLMLGVFGLPTYSAAIAAWIQPIASDPRWWIAVWFFLLLWLGGPRWIQRTTGKTGVRLWPLLVGVFVIAIAVYFLHGPRSAGTIQPVEPIAKVNNSATDSAATSDKAQPCVTAPAAAVTLAKSRWLKIDDATKWHFVKKMKDAIAVPGGPGVCSAVISHYPTPYAQGINAEARELLMYSDWKLFKGEPDEDTPDGLTIIAPKLNNDDPVWICAVHLQNMMREFADVQVPIKTIGGTAKTPNMMTCDGKCIEINIGNEPEATPSP
jgi:hypothetical protein